MHILCTELMELPTARLNCDKSEEDMQLAAKDLVHPMNSDHILGKTSLQNKPSVNMQKKRSEVGVATLIENHIQKVSLVSVASQ